MSSVESSFTQYFESDGVRNVIARMREMLYVQLHQKGEQFDFESDRDILEEVEKLVGKHSREMDGIYYADSSNIDYRVPPNQNFCPFYSNAPKDAVDPKTMVLNQFPTLVSKLTPYTEKFSPDKGEFPEDIEFKFQWYCLFEATVSGVDAWKKDKIQQLEAQLRYLLIKKKREFRNKGLLITDIVLFAGWIVHFPFKTANTALNSYLQGSSKFPLVRELLASGRLMYSRGDMITDIVESERLLTKRFYQNIEQQAILQAEMQEAMSENQSQTNKLQIKCKDLDERLNALEDKISAIQSKAERTKDFMNAQVVLNGFCLAALAATVVFAWHAFKRLN